MPKVELNAVDVLAAARELTALVGSRFDKAFQPTRDEVLLRFRVPRRLRDGEAGDEAEGGGDADDADGVLSALASSKADVAIGVGRYVCLTAFPRDVPVEPSQFAMTLRKHLSGARLAGVRQHEFDRVVEFELSKKDGTYFLVAEFFHDGNVILAKDGRVVAALLQQSWSSREVRPGAEFRMPPARANPKAMGLDEFRARVRASSADLVRTLAVELAIGGTWAEEACARSGVRKDVPAADATDAELDRVYDSLQLALRAIMDGDFDPVVASRAGEKLDVSPVPLAEHAGLELDRHPSFMTALDRYFSKPVTVDRVDPRVKRLNDERAKVQRMIDAQTAAIAKFEREAEESRARGDLLYGHFDAVARLGERILGAARQHGWKEVQDQLKGAKQAGQAYAHLVDALSPNEGKATFLLAGATGEATRVAFDLTRTVQENANDYYERSKKMREKLAGARVALAATQAKMAAMLAEGTRILESVEQERRRAKPTKRLWFETYRWFLSSDGNLVLAGRDASSNEKLVRKHLDDQDRYLHAEVSGAPSCVAKAREGVVPERTLDEAAQFAVSMSRAWIAGVGAGEAYWVLPSQVSKTPNPGEFVTRGAFIVRGRRNALRKPLRAGVGEVEVEGARKVMGGPPDAVKARAARFVVVEPGPDSKNALANRLAKAFNVPVEEVQAVLPPGDVRVIEERL